MFKVSPALLGALRTLGVLVLVTVLNFLSNSANLQGVVTPTVASIVVILAGALEQSIAGTTGKSMFGAVAPK